MEDKTAIILNSILYILSKFENQTASFHQTFKILYFAEQKHLARYGKSITNDDYTAMEYGPVPSTAYNMVKSIKNSSDDSYSEVYDHISIENRHYIKAHIEADLDWLSKTEIACLDESLSENIALSFGELTDKSHDSAWKDSEHWMKNLKIAEAGGANEDMLKYIASKNEIKRITF